MARYGSPPILDTQKWLTALDVELELARTGRPLVDDVMHFSRFGLNGIEDLLVSLAIDEPGKQGCPTHTAY